MSIDRLSDVLLLSDAIAVERADGFTGGRTRIAIEDRDARVLLSKGIDLSAWAASAPIQAARSSLARGKMSVR